MSRTRPPSRRPSIVASIAAVIALALSSLAATPAFAVGDIDIVL